MAEDQRKAGAPQSNGEAAVGGTPGGGEVEDDLELSLRALEKLDRSSPDLWPEQESSEFKN